MKKLVILALVSVAIIACTPKQPKEQTISQTAILTRTEKAVASIVELTEEFTSEIEPYKHNFITPATQGVHIDKILYEVGDAVREGDLVVTLDPTQYTQQLLQLQILEDDYNRLLPVYEAGGISAQQIAQAKSQLDVMREVVTNLKRNIEFTSPISGVVTARNYESGDLFSQQPILEIMQINPLKVMVNISEQHFNSVKVGQSVKLNVDIFPDLSFDGKVSLIYPALDPSTRTFKVEIKVPNNYKTLRPGMYTRATFDMGEKSGVMVPDVAIQKQAGSAERYLFVVKDGVAERRSVRTGRQVGNVVDILSGVEVGEEVAVTALSKLYDGVKVEVKTN